MKPLARDQRPARLSNVQPHKGNGEHWVGIERFITRINQRYDDLSIVDCNQPVWKVGNQTYDRKRPVVTYGFQVSKQLQY